jgi:hypothetical protein
MSELRNTSGGFAAPQQVAPNQRPSGGSSGQPRTITATPNTTIIRLRARLKNSAALVDIAAKAIRSGERPPNDIIATLEREAQLMRDTADDC